MGDPTILGVIRRMAGGDEHDLRGTILEALQELEASLAGGGGSYDIGTWLIVGGTGAAFENDWDGSGTLQYTKDSHGWVHIRGSANDVGASGARVFTLPVGMRPVGLGVEVAGVRGSGTNVVTVGADGGVAVSGALGSGFNYAIQVSFYVGA